MTTARPWPARLAVLTALVLTLVTALAFTLALTFALALALTFALALLTLLAFPLTLLALLAFALPLLALSGLGNLRATFAQLLGGLVGLLGNGRFLRPLLERCSGLLERLLGRFHIAILERLGCLGQFGR
jgi:hypothetical protein